jgi:hypothetical protein
MLIPIVGFIVLIVVVYLFISFPDDVRLETYWKYETWADKYDQSATPCYTGETALRMITTPDEFPLFRFCYATVQIWHFNHKKFLSFHRRDETLNGALESYFLARKIRFQIAPHPWPLVGMMLFNELD